MDTPEPKKASKRFWFIYWGVIFLVLIVGLVIFTGAYEKTIPVLSEPYGTDASEYYLYVPDSNHSTCTWTYSEKGTPQTFTTQPDPQTGQHTFIYNSTVTDMKVSCLSDQGVKYFGRF